MNLAVIRGLGSGEQAGHHLAWPLCKYHSSIAISNIRYYLPMRRMGSSSRVSSAAQLMLLCSRISLRSFSQHCGRWPEPRSVLVRDNASFHRSARVAQLCEDSGVKLVFLPPYSPDLNPIEEFFAELKSFIKRSWGFYEGKPDQGSDVFLEWCINTVGAKKESARGHFRHAGMESFEA